jgi:hypothetical protein
METNSQLEIKLSNTKPVELLDLTESLLAVAKMYERFLSKNPRCNYGQTGKLYVEEIKKGSIVTILADNWPAMLFPVIENSNSVVEFAKSLGGMVGAWLKGDPKDNQKDKADLEDLSKLVNPVAKDNGAVYNVTVNDGTVNFNNYVQFDSVDANAIQNKIAKFLAQEKETIHSSYEKVLFRWHQAKVGKGRKGVDMGIVEDITMSPVKTTFAKNKEIKKAMVEMDSNPFFMGFLVDVRVQTVEGKPKLYIIEACHEIYENLFE